SRSASATSMVVSPVDVRSTTSPTVIVSEQRGKTLRREFIQVLGMSQIEPTLSHSMSFQAPILARSLAQLATSFGGFFATCAAMYLCLAVSLWVALPMSVIAAGFLVRIFIIQHDCGHGSFFKSRRANDLIGILCSL